MEDLFSAFEGAVENTGKIAEMCNLEFTFGKYHLPEFQDVYKRQVLHRQQRPL